MRILIIRHADPEYHGDTLTKAGFTQANALAKRLSTGLEGNVTHIFSSPMGRAQATAAPTAKALGLPVTIEKWTRELTDWPNLPGSSDALRLWDVGGSDVPEVQNRYAELCAASDNFIETLGYRREGGRYQAIKPNRDIIAVFCHGGFGGAWISHLLGIPLAAAWSSFYLAPSSVTTILFDERGADKVAPRAIGVGDLAHLFAEGLTTPNSKYEKQNKFSDKPRPSGIRANFF